MALIPDSFINSVVSIGKKTNDGYSWIGTGFLVGKKSFDSKGHYPYLVTNRHVVKGLLESKFKELYIRLVEKDTKIIKEYPVDLNENTFLISQDVKVDIAVCFLDAQFLEKQIDSFGLFDIDANSFTSEEFINEGGAEGSFIYMLGFPMGLVDNYTPLPICRVGCIARINQEESQKEKRFLLDIQNFPGNSGSPIICKGETYSVNKSKRINKVALIGIVNSYIPYEETLINTQTNRVVEVKSENSGIAIANPVECIKFLITEDMKKKKSKLVFSNNSCNLRTKIS